MGVQATGSLIEDRNEDEEGVDAVIERRGRGLRGFDLVVNCQVQLKCIGDVVITALIETSMLVKSSHFPGLESEAGVLHVGYCLLGFLYQISFGFEDLVFINPREKYSTGA